MEDRVLIKRAIVKDIANAVREKSESSAKFQVSGLGDAIRAIGGTGSAVTGLGDAIRAIGGTGSAVTELAEAIAGPIAKDDISLANALAAGLTDAPAEQSWNGERATAGGGSIKDGVAFVDKIKGNSLKVVQLLDIQKGAAVYGNKEIIGESVIDYVVKSLSGAARIEWNVVLIENYKYLAVKQIISPYRTVTNRALTSNSSVITIEANDPTIVTFIQTATEAEASTMKYRIYIPTQIEPFVAGDKIEIKNPMLFDLTAMFGAGNEPATADEFAQRLGYASIDELPYIPYTEGEIVSMRASEIRSKGGNLWDEEVVNGYFNAYGNFYAAAGYVASKSYIPLPEGKALFFSNTNVGRRIFYDANKEFIGQALSVPGEFVPPANAAFMRFDMKGAYGGVYKSDICINISDPSFNGQYVPYMPPASLPLGISEILDADGNQLFPDGLCGIGDVRDEIDFARGKAVKRIGVVDLGTYAWIKQTVTEGAPIDRFACTTLNTKASGFTNLVCGQFVVDSKIFSSPLNANPNCICGRSNNQYVYISTEIGAYSSSSAFNTAMQGVLLYYELAEPIEVDINPAKAWYRAENGGREELVSDGWSAPLTADMAYRGISAEEFINAINE